MNHYNAQGSQKLPPFGRILLAYQQESIRLNSHITIYVGKDGQDEAFAEKRAGFLATFLPYGDDFRSYKWPVSEQKLIVQDTGAMKAVDLTKFCFYLINSGARVVFLYSDEHPNELILPPGGTYNG